VLEARPAFAYRPFDGTDGSVTDTGDFELELGPAHYYRSGGNAFIIAPATVLNLGIAPRFELVSDFKDFIAQRYAGPGSRASVLGTDLLLKAVAREGELQGKTGLSIAFEGGVLTPEFGGVRGFGAQLDGIFSKRWPALALHFNEQVALTRDHRFDAFSGVILVGPEAWPVAPVSELFVERTAFDPVNRSFLLGAIWQAAPGLAVDGGARFAHEQGRAVLEVRFGFTWAIGLWRG